MDVPNLMRTHNTVLPRHCNIFIFHPVWSGLIGLVWLGFWFALGLISHSHAARCHANLLDWSGLVGFSGMVRSEFQNSADLVETPGVNPS